MRRREREAKGARPHRGLTTARSSASAKGLRWASDASPHSLLGGYQHGVRLWDRPKAVDSFSDQGSPNHRGAQQCTETDEVHADGLGPSRLSAVLYEPRDGPDAHSWPRPLRSWKRIVARINAAAKQGRHWSGLSPSWGFCESGRGHRVESAECGLELVAAITGCAARLLGENSEEWLPHADSVAW